MTELKNRGVQDILIACVDGLKGLPEAVESVFPLTEVQLCIVHLVRHSLKFVGWKMRKEVARDLKLIYASATEAEAEKRLGEFGEKWDGQYPMIAKSWRGNWTRVIPGAPAGNSEDNLHHERHRIFEYVATQSDEDAGLVSK